MNWQEALDTAKALDKLDPLALFREEFSFPKEKNGKACTYLCGNSLGLMPKKTKERVNQELEAWQSLGVTGHFRDKNPWKSFHQTVSQSLAKLTGASESEVIAMNALTANLHFLMVSFYRPTKQRYKILIEETTFPSDRYAVESHLKFHGFDPKESLIEVSPSENEFVIGNQAVLEAIEKNKNTLALVLLPGIQYLSGERLAIKEITKAAHSVGATVGFDLAHAIGNIRLNLHDDQVDFAVWCHYKYLNSGPGNVGGAFIHQKHLSNQTLPRFNGWWGNEVETRFLMDKEFRADSSAGAWQVSNSPVLSIAALRGSLDVFDRTTIKQLREKGDRLTTFCEGLLAKHLPNQVNVVTPKEPSLRGNQLSLQIKGNAKACVETLLERNIIVDFRYPNIIRFSVAPLYNNHQDVVRFIKVLTDQFK